MGIGCRRDPLEANVWYTRAAEQGYQAAIQRMGIIRAAAADGGVAKGARGEGNQKSQSGNNELSEEKNEDGNKKDKKKFMGIF